MPLFKKKKVDFHGVAFLTYHKIMLSVLKYESYYMTDILSSGSASFVVWRIITFLGIYIE